MVMGSGTLTQEIRSRLLTFVGLHLLLPGLHVRRGGRCTILRNLKSQWEQFRAITVGPVSAVKQQPTAVPFQK